MTTRRLPQNDNQMKDKLVKEYSCWVRQILKT